MLFLTAMRNGGLFISDWSEITPWPLEHRVRQEACPWVSVRLQGLQWKNQPEESYIIIYWLWAGKVNNNKSEEWRLFWVVQYQRLQSQFFQVMYKVGHLRCLLPFSTVSLILSLWESSSLSKAPSNPQHLKHTKNHLLMKTEGFDFDITSEILYSHITVHKSSSFYLWS